MRFNPFRPNSIVTPEMFRGRKEELDLILQSLYQTKYGNPQHFLIEGERGLGKSSLFLMVEQFANGSRSFSKGTKLNFMVLSIELNSTQSFTDILRALAVELERAISEKDKILNAAKNVWNFLNNPFKHSKLEELLFLIQQLKENLNYQQKALQLGLMHFMSMKLDGQIQLVINKNKS
jgi:Cdc6-like AAA superfamily ATPase